MIATAEAEDKTTGGVLLPSSAQRKPTSGEDGAYQSDRPPVPSA